MAQRTARTSALLSTLRAVGRLRVQDLRRADAVPAAWLGALAVETSLARLGFDKTLRWIERAPRRRFSLRRPMTLIETKRVVAIAFRLQPFEGRCLSRSLVEYLLHRRSGVAVRFVVGVRRPEAPEAAHANEAAELEAHAWVEELAGSAGEPFTELLVATAPAHR